MIELRKKAKQQKRDHEYQRIVAAAMAKSQANQGQAEMAKELNLEQNQKQDQAGNQFGRHAHQQ